MKIAGHCLKWAQIFRDALHWWLKLDFGMETIQSKTNPTTLKRPFCLILGSGQDSHKLDSDFAKKCWIVNCKFPPTNLSQNRMVMNLGGYFWKSL